ncbi:hypothetical protein EXIGLDRAFT_845342 [Exidia glandulosa HHB12029]|uniref:Nucleotide-diphospho-sugar transferase domain-containing protein n=1 Tax=Exidia glandulosa HHB12029 TaxID=1314781 RepID=A0A165BHV8_EXIGL|nr:hypothetical protein EXIGLDRAFT_845342 [Exidia glandulosa HHB12029]
MLRHPSLVPFLVGAAVSFVFYSLVIFAPLQYDLRLSFLPESLRSSPQPATLASTGELDPLVAFRHAWSFVPSPAPATQRKRTYVDDPRQICVMAADTRPLAAVAPSSVPDDVMHALDFRTFSTYYALWWSLRHGYTYRMVRTTRQAGYSPIWSKTRAIRDMVANPDCKIVVFFDSDAYVTQPSWPIEDLLDRWGFHERAAMLLAMDQPVHSMPQNQNATNTGFMVFRSGQKALDILDAIMECPEKIPECKEWKMREKYEQTAFNLFVRPTLKEGEDLILVPCTEANGNFKNRYCKGEFVTHAWHALDSVTERAGQIMLRETFAWLATTFDGERVVDPRTRTDLLAPPAPSTSSASSQIDHDHTGHERRHYQRFHH